MNTEITASTFDIVRALLSQPRMLLARPSVNWFFCQYLRKFRVQKIGGRLIIHSHLPPLNSKAQTRFINEHLLAKSVRPSHAQIGVTHACPQDCEYCYNKGRAGRPLDTATIKRAIRELKELGVFWIGLTGGEPLMKKDLPSIVEQIGDDCASKLFTTGSGLTQTLAHDLKHAGLQYVSVSLDHWVESEHDRVRRTRGAFRTALRAIETFKAQDSLHVSVSAVLSRGMLNRDCVEEFLQFLSDLGVHEAWLSETKPSATPEWKGASTITHEEREMLIGIQDVWNAKGGMTVNYLGHFEDARHFGCTAGHKMIYIDPFGDVSPCVFVPMKFGNIRRTPLREIVAEMKSLFPSEESCFINRHFERLAKAGRGSLPLEREAAIRITRSLSFGPLARFFRLHYRRLNSIS